MATDTVLEERVFPCAKATVEELDEMVQKILQGNANRHMDLKYFLESVPQNKITKEPLRHLRIIGDAEAEPLENFSEAGINSGFYLNADHTWLLIILPKNPHLGDYLARYGKMVESLWMCNSQMYARDFRKLPRLQKLFLISNPLLDSLEHLDSLTRLKRLYIADCPRLTLLPGLGNLTQLTSLTLNGCTNLTALSGLGNLKLLTSLNLSACESLTELPGLENLKQLTSLTLWGCHNLTRLPGLENLTQLTRLDLSKCINLTALPGLYNLTRLTSLNLYGCTNLTMLPSLENLVQLTWLNLPLCSNLTALPGLENLKLLTSLALTGCGRLTALPGLENLQLLTSLSLLGCTGLNTLPDGLQYCRNLRKLALDGMHLQDLPDWLPEIAESFTTAFQSLEPGDAKAAVSLWATTVDAIPDMSLFDQPYEVVAEFFRKRALHQTHPLNEIKVVFLGDGEAGKSHTIARLMNDGGGPVGYVDVRTPGIVIKDKSFPVGDRNATLHFWDFGGQDIMHSMHRIFLTERTIYVVLVDASIGNQDERARYWLGNIQSFAKDAPVILVLNKLDDGLQADVNAVDLKHKYKGLKQIVKLSARQYSQERFNRDFRDVLLDEIEQTGYLNAQWPSSWIQVKNALEQMEENYIRGNQYLEICRRLNVDENQKPLLRWFHDLGISFCYCDDENKSLEDYVVLKPNWITNALYIILFNEREGGNGGLVPLNTIHSMLGQDAPNKDAIKRVIPDAYYVGYDVNYVLDVFHAFRLSFQKDNQHEFFPMLADVNAKPVAKEYAEDTGCLEFNMNFDYLPPNNLLHRLMVERNMELDIDNVWRTGARFQLPELGLSAVVVIDGNHLRFFIRHNNDAHSPNTYLTMLKANVDRIVRSMGLKVPTCQLIYKLDGRQDIFDFETLKAMHDAGQTQAFSMSWRKMIPIQHILNQSAPKGLEDEMTLLKRIIRACGRIQDEPAYRLIPNTNGPGYLNGPGMEDLRNRRIRDDLGRDYQIGDQTQRGVSSTGKNVGELDMLVYNDAHDPWTIIEALRVDSTDKSEWKKHLKKLTDNYNTRGFPSLYLLTYVDSDIPTFGQIWDSYQKYIQKCHPGQLKYSTDSFAEIPVDSGYQYIKTAKCQYSGSVDPITVYHIFVRIPKANEMAP